MIRGLLFDLDGTLVSTKKANFCAYRDAFAECGYSLSPAEFDRVWGRDSREFIPAIMGGASGATIAAIRARKSVIYAAYVDLTVPNRALIGFLKQMRPCHKTALVSTAESQNGQRILAAHGLGTLFDVLIFGDDVSRSKPDPQGYLKALSLLEIAPEEGIAFEDSAPGQTSAAAAGLRVVAVPEF